MSLELKCARIEQELLRSRAALSAVPIVLQEDDDRADATRIVVSATKGEEAIEGTGIYNVAVKVEAKVLNEAASSGLVDSYLTEIAAANKEAPAAPSVGYADALSALVEPAIFTIKSQDEDTTQEDGENTRKAERTFAILVGEQISA